VFFKTGEKIEVIEWKHKEQDINLSAKRITVLFNTARKGIHRNICSRTFFLNFKDLNYLKENSKR
jgi:hypothetical protein